MNILYFSVGNVTEGVRKKLEDKAVALNNLGLNCKLLLVVAPDYRGKDSDVVELVRPANVEFPTLSRLPVIWRVAMILTRRNTVAAIAKYIRQHRPQLILMRYPLADFFMWRMMKEVRVPVIFEHNSFERAELKIRAKDSFWYRYFLWGENKFGSALRRMATGIIGVTDEITKHELQLAGQNIQHATISNGIAIDRAPLRKGKPFDGETLNLLLLSGSEAPWHGIHVLLNSIERYQGPCKIHCFIAGNISATESQRIQSLSFATVLPNQTGKDLEALIDRCHIGIGTLALGVKSMAQACPLKVREYWARGLPFVIGYDDVDLGNFPEMNSYYLRVDVKGNEWFDLDQVVRFASRVYGEENVSEQMRNYARVRIDYRLKMKQYTEFVKSVMP